MLNFCPPSFVAGNILTSRRTISNLRAAGATGLSSILAGEKPKEIDYFGIAGLVRGRKMN
jgi:hypothetical protein